MILTEQHLGELARLPLCPKCGDTKFVEEDKTVTLSIPCNAFICSKCNIRWESLHREWNNNGFPKGYIRSSWGGF